ncbi:hypothetical protein [Sphingosinicella terrae]|nr:hypothetical protein [Sphingosinicella terrae]
MAGIAFNSGFAAVALPFAVAAPALIAIRIGSPVAPKTRGVVSARPV